MTAQTEIVYRRIGGTTGYPHYGVFVGGRMLGTATRTIDILGYGVSSYRVKVHGLTADYRRLTEAKAAIQIEVERVEAARQGEGSNR